MFLAINGTEFDVLGIIKVGRSFRVEEDSNAGTAISGKRIRSIVGTYLAHDFEVYRSPSNVQAFDEFWDFLKAHSVDDHVRLEAADGQETVIYDAYYTAARQDLDWRNNDTNLWGKINITFESIAPEVTPAVKRNRIVVGDLNNPLYVFENDQLRQVDVVLRSSFSGDELAYDQLNAATFAGENGNTLTIPDGTPVRYYVNDVLVGKFFAQPTTRENRIVYNISAVSAIGLLSKQAHKGGLYNGETFADVTADIVDGLFPFSCSPDVSSMVIVGWAPYSKDARENLHQLLFGYGVMVFKDEDGDVYLDFANTNFFNDISEDKTYVDGSVTPVDPVTLVRVAEHSFFKTSNDIEYTLFDNSGGVTADHQLVLFSNAPIYDIVATAGITVHESGVNYAIVSGNGTLTGKAYTHTQEMYERGTPGGNTIEITDQTFVNQLNSIRVANRLMNYYGVTETLSTDIQVEDEKPRQLVSVMNPYKERVKAYIREMTITGLATAKARCSMLENFTPTKGGNNYDHYELLTESGLWTIPDGVTMIRAQIGGGGQAGFDGESGQNGTTGRRGSDNPGKGGDGGAKGIAGEPGKVAVYNIPVSPGDVVTVTVGQGGQANGAYGGESSISVNGTTYTSADGEIPKNGIINQFTGDVYALYGDDGVSGGKGGDYTNPGEDVLEWHGGLAGRTITMSGGTGYGGGGGGAAVGEDGEDGANGTANSQTYYSGNGGNGANATAPAPTRQAPSCGGNGGHGGGGGGGGGLGDTIKQTRHYGLYGGGGIGSEGSPGRAGFVNIMY